MSSFFEEEQARYRQVESAFRMYGDDLYRYIYSKVGRAELAEDLVSTVFLKAFRWLQQTRSSESIRGWLYATARTTLIDYWQQTTPLEQLPLEMFEEIAIRTEQLTDASPATLRVQRLLQLLPSRERELLDLRFLQGYDTDEIARMLGVSVGNVRVIQLRALRRAAAFGLEERNNQAMSEEVERFEKEATKETRRVLELSKDEATEFKHAFIGTEHILLGLLREGSVEPVLRPFGVTYERVKTGINFIYRGMGVNPPPRTLSKDKHPVDFLTPRALQAFDHAGEEAKRLKEKLIRPEHVLLGLMQEGDGIAAKLLQSMNVQMDQVRYAIENPNSPPLEKVQICSFCQKASPEVERIFATSVEAMTAAGSPRPSFICNECVTRFYTALQEPDNDKTPEAKDN